MNQIPTQTSVFFFLTSPESLYCVLLRLRRMIESADGVEEDDEKRFIRFAPNFSEKKREKMTGFVLCVDAQSFPEWFGFSKLWSIKNLTEKIEEFVKVAKKIDLKLFVFLDAGKSSQNSLDTWFLRTEEKILREAQDCAPSLQMLVGEIFQSLGVQVYFSTSVIDHNDAIASFAHWNKGHILSLKKLFFEYKGSNYIVYNSLRVNEQGMMTLFKRKDFVRQKTRKLLVSDFVQHLGTSMPNFEETKEKKTYSRGMGSSLIKYTGNPHAKIVALRQALYGIMFANNTNVQIVEYVPEWYQNSVLWVKKIVEPTFETHYFAKTIDQLYTEFFGDQKRFEIKGATECEWQNHFLACKMIICEVVACATGKKMIDLLSDHILAEKQCVHLPSEALEQVEHQCTQFKKNGFCKLSSCRFTSGHIVCNLGENCRRGQKYCIFHHKNEKRTDNYGNKNDCGDNDCKSSSSQEAKICSLVCSSSSNSGTAMPPKYIPPHRR